jgi:hypothetical protein
VRLPQWAAAAGLTLGIATPAIALQVTALVARYTNRIKRFLKALITSLHRLATSSERLKRLIDELTNLAHRDAASIRDSAVTRPLDDLPAIPVKRATENTFSIEGISKAEREMLNRTIAGAPTEMATESLNKTYEVAFTDGTTGVFKPINTELLTLDRTDIPAGEMAYREVAASRLDEQLGFGLVPTTTLREAGPPAVGPGSMQPFVPGWNGFPVGNYPRVQEEKMAVLDYIMANTDRNWNNYRTTPDRGLVAIDHGLAFPTSTTWPITSEFVVSYVSRDLSPEVVDAVRAADPGRIRAVLHRSGLPEDAITGTLDRLEEVRVHGKITGEAWTGGITDQH